MAVPENHEVYEVFSCSQWEPLVVLEVVVTVGHKEERALLDLNPGQTETVEGIRFTVVNENIPFTRSLNNRFMRNSTSVAMLDTNELKTVVCASRADAQRFNCSFQEDMCHCRVAGEQGICSCADQSKYRIRADKRLPAFAGGLWMSYSNGRVKASYPSFSGQIQITMDDWKVVNKVDLVACTAEDATISGCYSCAAGAEVEIRCSTDFGETVGEVRCKNFQFPVSCKENAEAAKARVMVDRAVINEECQLKCAASTSSFRVRGNLFYVSESRDETVDGGRIPGWIPPVDISVIPNFLWDALFEWKKLAIVAGTVLLCAVVTVIGCQMLPLLRLWRFAKWVKVATIMVWALNIPGAVSLSSDGLRNVSGYGQGVRAAKVSALAMTDNTISLLSFLKHFFKASEDGVYTCLTVEANRQRVLDVIGPFWTYAQPRDEEALIRIFGLSWDDGKLLAYQRVGKRDKRAQRWDIREIRIRRQDADNWANRERRPDGRTMATSEIARQRQRQREQGVSGAPGGSVPRGNSRARGASEALGGARGGATGVGAPPGVNPAVWERWVAEQTARREQGTAQPGGQAQGQQPPSDGSKAGKKAAKKRRRTQALAGRQEPVEQQGLGPERSALEKKIDEVFDVPAQHPPGQKAGEADWKPAGEVKIAAEAETQTMGLCDCLGDRGEEIYATYRHWKRAMEGGRLKRRRSATRSRSGTRSRSTSTLRDGSQVQSQPGSPGNGKGLRRSRSCGSCPAGDETPKRPIPDVRSPPGSNADDVGEHSEDEHLGMGLDDDERDILMEGRHSLQKDGQQGNVDDLVREAAEILGELGDPKVSESEEGVQDPSKEVPILDSEIGGTQRGLRPSGHITGPVDCTLRYDGQWSLRPLGSVAASYSGDDAVAGNKVCGSDVAADAALFGDSCNNNDTIFPEDDDAAAKER